MAQRKTIRQWIKKLREPHKSRALEHYRNYWKGKWPGGTRYILNEPQRRKVKRTISRQKFTCLHDALMQAFPWKDTLEGKSYWKKIAERNT